MPPRKAVAVIAALLLAVGFALAVTTLTVGLGGDKVKCGSAYHPSYVTADIRDIVEPASSGSYVADCQEAVSGRRMVAYPLIGVAVVALLFVWLTGEHRTRWDAPADRADESAT